MTEQTERRWVRQNNVIKLFVIELHHQKISME